MCWGLTPEAQRRHQWTGWDSGCAHTSICIKRTRRLPSENGRSWKAFENGQGPSLEHQWVGKNMRDWTFQGWLLQMPFPIALLSLFHWNQQHLVTEAILSSWAPKLPFPQFCHNMFFTTCSPLASSGRQLWLWCKWLWRLQPRACPVTHALQLFFNKLCAWLALGLSALETPLQVHRKDLITTCLLMQQPTSHLDFPPKRVANGGTCFPVIHTRNPRTHFSLLFLPSPHFQCVIKSSHTVSLSFHFHCQQPRSEHRQPFAGLPKELLKRSSQKAFPQKHLPAPKPLTSKKTFKIPPNSQLD